MSHKNKPATALTGATGFLGSHLMASMLSEGYRIIILGRSSSDWNLEVRINKLLRWFGIEELSGQLEFVEIDLLKPKLGLTESDYRHLCEKSEEVIHCASDTSFSERKRDAVFKSNVDGLRSILDFTSDSKANFFHYISTAYVADANAAICMESLPSTTSFVNVYEESKARAENIIASYCNRNSIPFTIIRPSVVYGDSRTGRSLKFNALYFPVQSVNYIREIYLNDIINNGGKKSRQNGIFLDSENYLFLPLKIYLPREGAINIIPVDYFVKAAMIIINKACPGGIYHLTNNSAARMDVIAGYNEHFMKLRGVEIIYGRPAETDFRNPVEELFDRFIEPYRPYLSDRRVFDRTNTDLITENIQPPEFTSEIFQKCMKYAISVNWGKLDILTMAKVLLVNSNRFRHPWPVIPFGLCSIATVLEINGRHNVRFLDLCFSPDCETEIKTTIRSFKPDIIGISIRNIDDTGGYNTYFLLEDVKNDVIDYCKKEFQGPIVIGGPSVGISGREMLDYFDLEYAIRGDGEAVMPEFVNRIENHKSLEGLEGLIIRREKKIIQDSEPFRVQDLDSLPFPRPQRYLKLDHYRRLGSPIHIQTKRGCAFRCSYCTYNKIEGKRYRLRNPKLIADEIEILARETGILHLEFTDSIFNSPISHTKEVLKEVISKKLDLKLHTMGLSPANIDEELLDLMKDAGFNEVDIGAESLCEEVLLNLSKDFKSSDILKTAVLLKLKKIPATWFIMLGAAAETRKTVFETLDTIGKVASPWDLVFVSTGIRIYNGAPIANEIVKHNMHCTIDGFLRPVKLEPVMISLDDIYLIAKEFSFRFPNFYLYEKEHIIPGWLLASANFLLKIIHSRQPVWRLLILWRMILHITGIRLAMKFLYTIKMKFNARNIRKTNGFSLIIQK